MSKKVKAVQKVEISYTGVKPIVMIGAWPHDVKLLETPEELAEWERRMEAFTGVKHDAKAIIAGGGCCCGGDGDGMCDQD
ncbi:hypothetical protein WI93_09035 [Burkholderia vietnamiensis]|uniref:hypothetical protein n=1 Tax=Burkholderia vietnamiensis TaxID=60552 RepID=UPI00075E0B22|nr:hypothetical protein [Burkholderia vietnamiensis]KVE29944.1 hypothetical protein WI93_09035 [Burkholderia vietnamiensis]